MPLYLGSERKKIILNGVAYRLNLFTSSEIITNGIKLLSSENYVLKDVNGVYLTVEEINYLLDNANYLFTEDDNT